MDMTPKPASGFSDEDLAQLKERMKVVGGESSLFGPLLARLEAAEQYANYPMTQDQTHADLREAWMKSRGEAG